MIDIDHFKLYNDHYGHQQGDFCLRQVAKTIQSSLEHDDDLGARYGGEEFAVVLPNTNKKNAEHVAKRILSHLNQQQLKHGKSPTDQCVTISIGVGECYPDTMHNDKNYLIKNTDKALYNAKKKGRNCYSMMT